jgi:hypothetical protein
MCTLNSLRGWLGQLKWGWRIQDGSPFKSHALIGGSWKKWDLAKILFIPHSLKHMFLHMASFFSHVFGYLYKVAWFTTVGM